MKLFTLKNVLLSLSFLLGFVTLMNGQNLVSNPGLETWTDPNTPSNWVKYEMITQESGTIHGGTYSAKQQAGTSDLQQDVSGVVGGNNYTISYWFYDNDANARSRIWAYWLSGGSTISDNAAELRPGTYSSDNGSWQEYTVTIDAPASADGFRFEVRSYNDNAGGGFIFYDDFSVIDNGGGGGPDPVQAIYFEPFDTDLGSTTQYTVLGPDQSWEWTNFGNPPGSAKMSGFSGAALENEDWLITTVINCNNYSDIMLSFDHALNYCTACDMSVLISTDYDGSSDPTTTGTWTDITSNFTFPPGNNWTFIASGAYDISSLVSNTTYIAFKYISDNTQAATWEVDNIKVVGEFEAFARIPGSFNGWSTTDPEWVTSPNANGLLQLTKNLPAATHEYKVLEGDNWDTDESYPGNNQQIVLSQAQDVTWKVNYNSNLVSHTLPTVAGSFMSELGGNDWDPTDPMGQMLDPDGDDVYELEVTIPTEGYYEFKVTLNNNWDQNTGYGFNVPFYVNGTDPVTFIYSFVDDTILSPSPTTATITFVVNDSQGKNYDGFYLKGSWNAAGFYDSNWGNGMEHAAFNDDGTDGDATADDNIWTCQQELVIDGNTNTWQWGVNDTDHNWVKGNWEFSVPDADPQTLTWNVPNEPALVINEIMYNSIGTDQEWIELYNNTGAEINLENWRIVDSDASHPAIVIPAGYSLAPDSYFTIAVEGPDPFPFTPDYDGRGKFALNNSGDVVRLWNADNILVDIVIFSDTDPWPTAPDGDGPSLSLIDPETDNSLAENWAASLEEGGTPGMENFPPIPFVSVTNPQGGEYIEQGSEFEITWISGFWDGQIKIQLVKEGEDPELLAYNLPLSDNSFLWNVWDEQPIGDDFKIRISGLEDGDPVGESEGYFSIIVPYVAPTIVISEIMYNPPEVGDDSLEFLEFHNNGAEMVDMSKFMISKGVEFVFPIGTHIMPDTFLLVAKNSEAMFSVFGVESMQWTSGSLSNGGEPVELVDSLGILVDFVPYDDALPWDTLADGYGPSLTLCNSFSDNSSAENWTSSVHFAATNSAGDSIFATPGFECQVQLLASFVGMPTYLPIGDSVMFTDQSIGDIISWDWTFEGGTPNTFSGQNPPHIVYDEVGDWNVTLVVTDGLLTDSLTKTNYIHTGIAPVADFKASETQVLAGSYTNFSSLATGENLTFEWFFEGGTPETSEEENPAEIYYLIMDWDTYDVTLIATNEFGSDTLTKVDYIEVFPESIDEKFLTGQNVKLFPNPNNGNFKISVPAAAEASVDIFDLQGQMVFSTNVVGTNDIDVIGLRKGVYFVKVYHLESGSVVVKRLIIQ